MRIIIVGAGRTGTQLARRLVQEKHEVSLVESNEECARHLSNRLDCLVLHDEGNSLATLEEAGAAKANALVCVTGSDEINMIICGLAASRYPDLLKIARVRNDDYMRLKHNAGDSEITQDASGRRSAVMGIDYFVHPDVETARAVLRSLSRGAMGNILDFAGTSYELGSIIVAEKSVFDGLCLKDYRSVVKEDSLITLIEKDAGTSVQCLFPTGRTVLRKGDRIHILAPEALMEHIFRYAGHHDKPLRRIGIVGGGHICTLITEGILGKEKREKRKLLSVFNSFIPKSNRRVVIVEQNYEVCKELSARFPEALVLNEDISDESFVAEERIGDLDFIITATSNQELNIIAAIYLKSLGVRRAIAMVSGSGHENIARQLGVDVVIPMHSVLVESILSNLMDRHMHEVHRLGDGTLEILQTEIQEDSPAVDKPITEFKLSEGGLIMLVNRGGTSFIPRGEYVFSAGDEVIFICKQGSEEESEKFFGSLK
jgi:trk system potassium uptake protein TrkA